LDATSLSYWAATDERATLESFPGVTLGLLSECSTANAWRGLLG